VLLLVLVAVGVYLIVGAVADFDLVLTSVREAEPAWLALAALAAAISVGGHIVSFGELAAAEGGPRFDLGLASRVVLASFGANMLVAGTGLAGLGVLYWTFRRAGAGGHETVVRILAFNVVIAACFAAIGWLAAISALAAGNRGVSLTMLLVWALVVPVLAGLGAGLSSRGVLERTARQSRTRGVLRRSLVDLVESVAFARRVLTTSSRRWTVLSSTLLFWLCEAVCLWAGLSAFDVHAPLAALLLGYLTGYLAMLLPIPVGNVGGVDAAMVFALAAVGIPLAPALLGVVVYRFFAFWLPTLVGIAALLSLKGVSDRIEAAAVGKGVAAS
jgi:uncharacterized membrane protein YbhN (UPF0104 family)